MEKSQFLNQFVFNPKKITMLFNVNAFIADQALKITTERISTTELLDYYVPKYEKNGKRDARNIEQQITDPYVSPLTVRQVKNYPARWDLDIDITRLPAAKLLEPVPVATDLKSGKTLLLDSSHTITNMIMEHKLNQHSKIDIVRISGSRLDNIVSDFAILNRT